MSDDLFEMTENRKDAEAAVAIHDRRDLPRILVFDWSESFVWAVMNYMDPRKSRAKNALRPHPRGEDEEPEAKGRIGSPPGRIGQ
jgi:hypothetical protein